VIAKIIYRLWLLKRCRDSRLAERALSISPIFQISTSSHPKDKSCAFAHFYFIFADSARARLALYPISCPSHVRWCSLVCFSCYFLLSNISPSSYSRRCAACGTENPYYMYTYLYLAYSARNIGPARLATLAVLHICWTSCRCSGSLFPPATSSV
jgi:hypothetical protein